MPVYVRMPLERVHDVVLVVQLQCKDCTTSTSRRTNLRLVNLKKQRERSGIRGQIAVFLQFVTTPVQCCARVHCLPDTTGKRYRVIGIIRPAGAAVHCCRSGHGVTHAFHARQRWCPIDQNWRSSSRRCCPESGSYPRACVRACKRQQAKMQS